MKTYSDVHTDFIRTVRKINGTTKFLTGSYDKTVKLIDFKVSQVLTTFQ